MILSESEGTGFIRKGDARKYSSKLTKYIAHIFANETLQSKPYIDCDERESFLEYQYVSAGPSISYRHIDITVEELLSFNYE